MLSSTAKIVQEQGQHIIYGSYGTLLVDDATGNVVQYQNLNEEGTPNYQSIVRFDVDEYVKWNQGFMDDTDILLIGYWTENGTYEPPVHEERVYRSQNM